MPLPTGQISMSQVNVELGLSATAQLGMNDSAVRALAGVPTGQIGMSNLQGKSAAVSVAIGQTTAPFIAAYKFSGSGFGTKYANPATALPNSVEKQPSFASDGSAVVISAASAPTLVAYAWSASGFGTKYADPATALTGGRSNAVLSNLVANGGYVSVTTPSTPWAHAYKFSSVTGWGTKFANPAPLMNAGTAGLGTAFNPNRTAVTYLSNNAPFVHAYAFSDLGFGTKYANPSTAIATGGSGTDFSPDGAFLGGTTGATPFLFACAWSASGFGTRVANPAVGSGFFGLDFDFAPNGNAVAQTEFSGFGMNAYAWSASGFGTKYANPGTALPGDYRYSIEFSPDSSAVAVTMDASPFLRIYGFSGSGFGTAFSNPATPPTTTGNVGWSPV